MAQGINGATLSVSGSSWSSSGTLNVATNSTLVFSGVGTNTGVVNVTNGRIEWSIIAWHMPINAEQDG